MRRFNFFRFKRTTDQFKLLLLLLAANLLLFVVLALLSLQSLNSAQRNAIEVLLIQKGVADLSTLGQDYFDSGSPRALRQWRSKYATVHSQIVNLSLDPGDGMQALSRLGRGLSDMHDLLEQLKETEYSEMRPERKRQLSSTSRYLATEISALIVQLSNTVRKQFRAKQVLNWLILFIFFILSNCLIATITLIMWRNSTRSISSLHQGIRMIEDGEIPKFEDNFEEDMGAILRRVSVLGETIFARHQTAVSELKIQSQIAEKASRAKSAFLANVSHEIRTPLSIIDGYTKMLMTSKSSYSTEYLSKIHWNVQYLIRLINEILDLSKIDAQKMGINSSSFYTLDLRQLFDSLANKAKKAGLAFQLKCLTPLPIKITSDQTRIEQILINLIGNAIKYTRQGAVAAAVNFKAPWLVFEITDTGIGLSRDQSTQIFSPFYQANPSQTEGTGLGLAISIKTAELLGGKVYLKRTELGVGSTFVFEFPVQDFDSSEMISTSDFITNSKPTDSSYTLLNEKRPARALFGTKILVAEDNEDIQLITKTWLEKAGAEVTMVPDGADVIELLCSKKQTFDLVILDIQMRIMDGYTTCKEIRKFEHDLIVLACSAHVQREEKEKALAAGMNGYLEKPLNMETLIHTLHTIHKERLQSSLISPIE